jgi:hypothetical protein
VQLKKRKAGLEGSHSSCDAGRPPCRCVDRFVIASCQGRTPGAGARPMAPPSLPVL